MTRRIILDVSSYQEGIDFERVKRDSPEVVGVIIKATEGEWSGTNPHFEEQYASARAAGLAVGFYLFDHTDVDAAVEAQTYLDRVRGKRAELGHWIDFEANAGGLPPAAVARHLDEVLSRISSVYPMKTGVYSAPWAWDPWTGSHDASRYPLWLAGYTESLPPSPAHWATPIFWQYTDKYATHLGGVDASVFLGSEAAWAWLTTGAVPSGETPHITTGIAPDEKDPIVAALPNITATDRTHPKAMQLWRDRLKAANPAIKAKTDPEWAKATEEFRGFLSHLGGKPEPAPRIGEQMWAAVLAFSVTEPKK